MGLPDSRDIEPVRENFSEITSNDEPEFVVIDENELNDEQIEIDENSGYLRLRTFEGDDIPANDSDTSDSEEDEDEDENEVRFPVDFEASFSGVTDAPVVSAESEIQAQIWNQPRVQDTIELNTEKTQQILKAMSGFKLPNVPDWAKEVNATELVKTVLSKKDLPATSETDSK